jgi:hypothetical protein
MMVPTTPDTTPIIVVGILLSGQSWSRSLVPCAVILCSARSRPDSELDTSCSIHLRGSVMIKVSHPSR